MHLVSYIDTQIARVTPLSVARIFGGLLPRLCSFMLILKTAKMRPSSKLEQPKPGQSFPFGSITRRRITHSVTHAYVHLLGKLPSLES